jgi:hypothetical protein
MSPFRTDHIFQSLNWHHFLGKMTVVRGGRPIGLMRVWVLSIQPMSDVKALMGV